MPILALLIGAWLLYNHFATQGAVARVSFETAEGLEAGKTEVRCRSVRVGTVRKVELAENLASVISVMEIDEQYADLLRKGTRFWVVRPRLTATQISGVDTLITGAYVELDPGPPSKHNTAHVSEFTGLETPPATNTSVPGRRIVLTSEEAESIGPGSPIYYRGIEVGRIESRDLDSEQRFIAYKAFVREEYSHLITTNVRFWNSSGIDITADASGFKLRTPSVQAMFTGGVSFHVPDGVHAGDAVPDNTQFSLYANRDEAEQSNFNATFSYVLLFDQSVRGLTVLAPVEFRGIKIGRVASIGVDDLPSTEERSVPVLIEVDPTLLRKDTAAKMDKADSEFIRELISRGLRGALKTGSLITGAMYVDFDYYPEAAPAEISTAGEYTVLPTVSSGFAQLEAKLTAILDKLQAVPMQTAVTEIANAAKEAQTTIIEARDTLSRIDTAVEHANTALSNPAIQQLPTDLQKTLDEMQKTVASIGPESPVQGDLLRTLDELRASLRSLKTLTNSVEDKPNSLLFGRDSTGNPKPRAPRGR